MSKTSPENTRRSDHNINSLFVNQSDRIRANTNHGNLIIVGSKEVK
jgi:hypothetical protein